MDGGFGTALIARGLDTSKDSTALWNFSHPDDVLAVHREFAEAGAGLLQTNTFMANRIALHRMKSGDVAECNRVAVGLARKGASGGLVAGIIGPTGELPPPQGDADLHLLEEVFAEQASVLAAEGVDFLHLETMVHPKELRAALRGCQDGASKLPVVASICSQLSAGVYKSTLGFAADALIAVALEERVSGIGVNCMLPPAAMAPLVSAMLALDGDLPVFAQPTIAPNEAAPLYPEEFAQGVLSLFDLGAAAVGGCCGTGAEDIRAVSERLQLRG
jgi:5-methyltetrahydrofolate--homocysteine methyltransferase